MHIKKSLELLDAKIDRTLREIADSGQLPTLGQLEKLHLMLECRKHIPMWKKEYYGQEAATTGTPPAVPAATLRSGT